MNLELERSVQGRARTTRPEHARPSRETAAHRWCCWPIDDVTDARQAETLRIDAETLRLVDQRKDEFLGILAHELRNPLAPMRFALEILRRSDGDLEQGTRARQVLDRQVNHMVRIVDDLLDVSRITQGKVELRKERLELGEPRRGRGGALPAWDQRVRVTPDRVAAGRARDRSTAIRCA